VTRRRAALLAVAVLAVAAGAGLLLPNRSPDRPIAALPRLPSEQKCNGDEVFCGLTLDRVVFPGTHNSMSSSAYPGWLFGAQGRPIRAQLDAGIRALLVDTYYGRIDPAASQQAGRPVVTTAAAGDIFLCHAHCELGALPFAGALAEVKGFLDANPDDVVVLILQDATTPVDTAAAIAAAGLSDRAATLRPGRPLPSLGELVDAGRTLLVFAEKGGGGAPAWYHRAFDWFQDTPFAFTDPAQMGCQPNRGRAAAPLFLVNHWVTASPPDPAAAAAVNSRPRIEQRFHQCLAERGRLPNVVAVDFADQDVVATLRDLNRSAATG
jgi:hypothetical protein